MSSSYTLIISVTCTLDTNGGNAGAAGLVGWMKLAPTIVQYATAVSVSPRSPRSPRVLPYALRSMPVAFWLRRLCMLLMDSKFGSSGLLGIFGCMNKAMMLATSVLDMVAVPPNNAMPWTF
eukprot:13322350-Ditylum_brightwellii.AAC.1